MSHHKSRRDELSARELQEGLERLAEDSLEGRTASPGDLDGLQWKFGLPPGLTNLDELRKWFNTSFLNAPWSDHARIRIRFAIQCIDHDDTDFYYKNRWDYPNHLPKLVPDRTHWAEFLVAGLEDYDGDWRATATKWLPEYAPSADWAVERLTGLLNDPYVGVRWWAAMHLSRLAPWTSGVADFLLTDLYGASTVPVPEGLHADPVRVWRAANPGKPLPLLKRNMDTWNGFPVVGSVAYRSYTDYCDKRDEALAALARVRNAAERGKTS